MSEMSQTLDNRIQVAIRQRLESLRRAGVRQLPHVPVVSSVDGAVVAEQRPELVSPSTGATKRETVAPSEPGVAAPDAIAP
jgi:hypothetical protein